MSIYGSLGSMILFFPVKVSHWDKTGQLETEGLRRVFL